MVDPLNPNTFEDDALPPSARLVLEGLAAFAARPLEEQVQFMKDVGIFDENCDLAAPYWTGTNGSE